MIIYSVGDEYTGESTFYPSRKSATAAAQGQANHHGHCCYVEKHEFKTDKKSLMRFLNYLPIERIQGETTIEPCKQS